MLLGVAHRPVVTVVEAEVVLLHAVGEVWNLIRPAFRAGLIRWPDRPERPRVLESSPLTCPTLRSSGYRCLNHICLHLPYFFGFLVKKTHQQLVFKGI